MSGLPRSRNTDRVRRNMLRGLTLLRRTVQHPTWAVANAQNYLDQRHDRQIAKADVQSNCSLEDALRQVAGADAQTVARVLGGVPQPVLHRRSVLYGDPNGSRELVALVYACCRLLQPSVVVETGVANGYSTAAILRALSENERGALVSIDLPHLHPQAEQSIGAAVDPSLYDRWRLHLGPATRALKRVPLDGEIDIFVQDAAHTVRGQLAEYRSAWPRMKHHGLLISDDVGHAFEAFAGEVGRQPLYVDQTPKASPIGILVK